TPGRPRLRLPDFWVSVSPVLPSMSGMPCATARGIKATKSNIFRRLLCRASTEVELIGYKELAADDEEKDDAREYVAEGLVQAEVGGYLAGAAVEEHQQEAG